VPPIKLWLDDLRSPPSEDWTWVKSAAEAIAVLKGGLVEEVSLDHDLGDDEGLGTGGRVADWIEEKAWRGELKPLRWRVHSANPVGAQRMRVALARADAFWASASSRSLEGPST
jgi:hypothetical protein